MIRNGKHKREGAKFKRLRHSLGMTQVELAEWLDLCPMTPSEYERGNLRVPRALWLLLKYAVKDKAIKRSHYVTVKRRLA